jgi:hypothetical protein
MKHDNELDRAIAEYRDLKRSQAIAETYRARSRVVLAALVVAAFALGFASGQVFGGAECGQVEGRE